MIFPKFRAICKYYIIYARKMGQGIQKSLCTRGKTNYSIHSIHPRKTIRRVFSACNVCRQLKRFKWRLWSRKIQAVCNTFTLPLTVVYILMMVRKCIFRPIYYELVGYCTRNQWVVLRQAAHLLFLTYRTI